VESPVTFTAMLITCLSHSGHRADNWRTDRRCYPGEPITVNYPRYSSLVPGDDFQCSTLGRRTLKQILLNSETATRSPLEQNLSDIVRLLFESSIPILWKAPPVKLAFRPRRMAPSILSEEFLVPSAPVISGVNLKYEGYPRDPLELSGALDEFQFEDATPVIGREYINVNIVDDLLHAPNADARIRDLAITSKHDNDSMLYHAEETIFSRSPRCGVLPRPD